MIGVCLVEDQTIVREGLLSLLRMVKDFEVVGEAADGGEAVRLICERSPDVVLLDFKLPKLDGLQVLERIRASRKLPPTIILTTFDDDRLVLEAVRLGVKGFLLKDVSLEQLTDAIRRVHAGGTLIKPALTNRVLKWLRGQSHPFPSLDRPDPLTDREVEILRLTCGGYSNREIAEALCLAEGTVKNHISSILSKLGVRDRTRAVLRAVELGYLG
jgi:DNA-binding NarL/FixJ family response regulator